MNEDGVNKFRNILRKVELSDITFIDGKTIKNRYDVEEIKNYNINLLTNTDIVSWDEEKRVLIIETKKEIIEEPTILQ